MKGFPLDILLRITRVVRDEDTQAAISIRDNATGELALYTEDGADLGSGRSAATGLGKTICIDGYVAFGDGCFIATTDDSSKNIRRGTLDENGNLAWMPVFSAGAGGDSIRGISYCGGYFFVTSITRHDDGSRTCYIARGADSGRQWNETTFLDGAEDCGAVASKPDGVTAEGTPKILYCSVGAGAGDDPNYGVIYSATSSDGLSWTTNVSDNPASGNYIGAGKDIFVCGGFEFSVVTNELGFEMGTGAAQANWSSSGGDWAAVDQPVPGGTADAASFCEGAVFVKTGEGDGGYFIAVTDESTANSVYVVKSITGKGGWTVINLFTGSDPDDGAATAGLSVIGKNIGTVVQI